MERLIEDANRVKEANGEMADLSIESFADVTEAIHIIQTEMGITGTTAKEADSTITGSLNSVKASWENLMVAMADPKTDMSKIFDELIASVKTFGKNVIPIAEEALMGVAELINELLPEIVEEIPVILEEFLPILVEAGTNLLTGLITGITENLDMLVPTILSCIMTIINVIIENLPLILQMGIQIIVQLIQGIAQQAPTLIPQIIDCIMLMVDTILDNLDLLIDAGIELIIALAMGLIDALPEIIDKIPIIIEKLLTAIAENLPKLMEMGIKLIIQLALGLIKAIPQLVSKIPQIISAIVKAFGTYISSMFDVGKNLIKGLWNGLKSAWEGLKKGVADLAGSIVSKFKSVFGIRSPSRVFKDQIGKYLAQGVGVGFEDELGSVYDSMQKAIDLETEKMSANVQTGNVYNNVMNTTPVQVNGTYTSRLEVNGEVLAEVVNDVNDKKDLQYMF